MGEPGTASKPFKAHGIGEAGGISICCPNLQIGEYRICSIIPAHPIPLDWQLACFVDNLRSPVGCRTKLIQVAKELDSWLSDVGEVH
jgi:hypothetical protein